MVDKMKGKQVAIASHSSNSPVTGSPASVNTATPSNSVSYSQPGEALASKEQPLWNEIEVVTKTTASGGGNVRFLCKHCQCSFVGSYTRVKAHLLKLPQYGIRACKKISIEKAREFKRLQDHADAMHKESLNMSMINASLPPKSVDKKRKTIETCFDSYGRSELDNLAAQFFFSGCIPFNAARNPFWKKFVTAVANSRLTGYVPPSSEKLRTSLLQSQKSDIELGLESKKFKWDVTGVSIVSDGWTDIQKRPLINFIAIARDEPIFLKAIDATGEYKDAEYLKRLFINVINEIGPKNVVQIITDNAPVCRSAGMGLLSDFPHIFWTPCVAHTLNLALKDICNPRSKEEDPEEYELFSWIQDMERDARNIRNFIVNHQQALSLFGTYSDLKLLRVAETRFASIIIVLKRLFCVRDALIQMVASRNWCFYRTDDENKAKAIKAIIVEDAWWTKIEYFLKFTEPIWCMLRAVDKDEPMLHKVYEMWDVMIEQIQSIIFEHEKKDISKDKSVFFYRIHQILVDRWDKSNTPLHCMAHTLNPKYYTRKWKVGAPGRVSPNVDAELSKNRRACLDRLFAEDEEIKTQAVCEYTKFSLGEFSSESIGRAREDDKISPFDWWTSYGDEFPVLRKIALRLLSQPVTSSCCERNWSTYSHIHNIKRNKLTSKRAEDLVYVHSNLRLLSRKQQEYSCGSSQYWDVDSEEFDFERERNLHTANMGLVDPEIPSNLCELNDEAIESIEENEDGGSGRI